MLTTARCSRSSRSFRGARSPATSAGGSRRRVSRSPSVTHDIEEAISLGDRVVLTARPARVREEVAVDLPRPRDVSVRKSVALLEYRNHVGDLIRSEAVRS